MTGYELLIDALKQRGYSTAKLRANEALIADIVTILANSDAAKGAMSMIEELRRKLERAIKAADEKRAEYNDKYDEAARYMDELHTRERIVIDDEAKLEKERKELEETRQMILAAETPEARDRIRLLTLFTITIPDKITSAENKALIYSIGNILSGCGYHRNGGEDERK